MMTQVSLLSLNGKPVADELDYLKALRNNSKSNVNYPHQEIKLMWDQAAKKLQNEMGNKFIITLKKSGTKYNSYDFYKLVIKKVEKLKKVILFIPMIKKNIKGTNQKYFETSYLNNQVLNEHKQFINQ